MDLSFKGGDALVDEGDGDADRHGRHGIEFVRRETPDKMPCPDRTTVWSKQLAAWHLEEARKLVHMIGIIQIRRPDRATANRTLLDPHWILD
tara:strand:+ start:190 stop:465 length:276 start_codon:yes stop_codon:yes gene_type:complete